MKPLKEKISITLDNDLLEKLRYRAERDDRSLSSLDRAFTAYHFGLNSLLMMATIAI